MIEHRDKAMITYLCLIQKIWVQSSAQKPLFLLGVQWLFVDTEKFLYGPVN